MSSKGKGKVCREHYAFVRRITPKERLLEYKLGSGWEPLCEFLGKSVPDVPFPRINETAALNEKAKGALVAWRGVKNICWKALKIAMPVAAAALGWWVYKRTG